jgi:hypothetical protein
MSSNLLRGQRDRRPLPPRHRRKPRTWSNCLPIRRLDGLNIEFERDGDYGRDIDL